MLEDDDACKPAKKLSKKVKEYAAPMENERCKSLEEYTLAKEETPSERTSKAAVASSREKRRTSASTVQDSDSQPGRKHIKLGTTDINLSSQELKRKWRSTPCNI